jgi:hypothetical protein
MIIPNGDIHVGFSGTREGMRPPQLAMVRRLVHELATMGYLVSHDGDCIGGDEEFHAIAVEFKARTIGHPPISPTYRAHMRHDETRPLEAYLVRNRKIVDESAVQICAPLDVAPTTQSGTWSTIRYAQAKGVPLAIVWPDGSTKITEDWP